MALLLDLAYRRVADEMSDFSWSQVTPEVFRELDHSRNRGEKGDGPVSMDIQSTTGKHTVEDPQDMPPVIIMEED